MIAALITAPQDVDPQSKESTADAALSFLTLLPHAHHNLVAIDPETKAVSGISRAAGHADLGAFIELNSGKRNLYFSVNEPKTSAPDKKLEKADIGTLWCVCADLDAKNGNYSEARAQRAAQLTRIREDDAQTPTWVIDSGGGYGLFWMMPKGLPATADNIRMVESQGLGIAVALDGDHVQNIDRIMRLPGTINLPDAGKRARGRVAAPATLLHSDGPLRELAELQCIAAPHVAAAPAGELPDVAIDVGAAFECSSHQQLPGELRKRLLDLETKSPAFANFVAGSFDDVAMVKDRSGSGQIFSLACFVRANAFTADEFAKVAWVWPHTRPSSWLNNSDNAFLIGRDLTRAWQRASEDNAAYQPKTEVGEDFGPASAEEARAPSPITATPYAWPNPKEITPRQFLFGGHYIRGYASGTAAPGGIGKTSHSYVEAMAMASGRALLGGAAPRPLRVWIWNGEDPIDEVQRRLAAISLHYGIAEQDVSNRLFVDTGQTAPIIVAKKSGENIVVAEPLVAGIIRQIRENQIDVLIIDPFVSSHGVPENDNGSIDRVTKTWSRIANATSCAVELIHHVRKSANGAQGEFTVDDARGGGAFVNALRSARVINAMSKAEAEKAGIPAEQRRSFIRVDNGKANMQPPLEKALWRKLVSVPLDNATEEDAGDWVGVATAWAMPDASQDITIAEIAAVQSKIEECDWAENAQASNWAGRAVAEVLEIDLADPAARQRVKTVLQGLLADGTLKKERVHDARAGREKPLIRVGERV